MTEDRVEDERGCRIHAWICRGQHQDVSHHRSRAAQEHQRESQLPDDQGRAPTSATPAAGDAACHRFDDVGPGGVERRHESEEDRRCEANRGEIHEDSPVDRELQPVGWMRLRREEPEDANRPAESARPSRPAHAASTRLSTRSCRTMRQRLAPIDIRTETSCARVAARASSRLATFAHAISRTNATAPVIAANSATMGPPTPLRKASRRSSRSRSVSGYALASDAITPCRSARAWSRVTDSRNRPNLSADAPGDRSAHRRSSAGQRPPDLAIWPGNQSPRASRRRRSMERR